jgi:hypothetical protein
MEERMAASAKAPAGRQIMISSLYEEYCADCREITEHAFLASNTVVCRKCRRLIFIPRPMLATDIRR